MLDNVLPVIRGCVLGLVPAAARKLVEVTLGGAVVIVATGGGAADRVQGVRLQFWKQAQAALRLRKQAAPVKIQASQERRVLQRGLVLAALSRKAEPVVSRIAGLPDRAASPPGAHPTGLMTCAQAIRSPPIARVNAAPKRQSAMTIARRTT